MSNTNLKSSYIINDSALPSDGHISELIMHFYISPRDGVRITGSNWKG